MAITNLMKESFYVFYALFPFSASMIYRCQSRGCRLFCIERFGCLLLKLQKHHRRCNRGMVIQWISIVTSVIGFSAIAPALAELPRYQLTNLGTLIPVAVSTSADGFIGYSDAKALNLAGDVVGFSFTSEGYRHAFLYDGTTMRDIGVSAGSAASEARSINDEGIVVGILERDTTKGFAYDGSNLIEFRTLGGTNSSANGINNRNVVVGSANTTGDTAEQALAYLCYQLGSCTQSLITLGGTNSVATSVSEDGGIAGYSDLPGDSARHAFLLYLGTYDLGTLGGSNSRATAVNANGAVVGVSDIVGNVAQHAFLYEGPLTGTPMRDLGTLGGTNSLARGINTAGHVVGEAETTEGDLHAFLDDGTGMRDINDLINPRLGFTVWSAAAINDVGQIAAIAWNSNTAGFRAVRLTPILLTFDRLIDAVIDLLVEKKLLKPATLARSAYVAQNLEVTCTHLDEFNRLLLKLPAKKLAQFEKDRLSRESIAIKEAIGCVG